MSTQKIGVAVIGLGVGERHLYKYLADTRCEVRWIVDHNVEKTTLIAHEAHVNIASSFEEILQDELVKIVSIASFDNDHASQVLQALNAGKHVFVEKPLCQTIDQLKEIKQTWLGYHGGVKLASNLILRTAPIYKWLRNQITNGLFGDIYSFDGEYLYGRLNKITDGWRNSVENYSVIEGGGLHMIDLMLWLIDERPKKVHSIGNNISTDGSKFQYNDFSTCSFQMESGLVSRIVANFGCVHRHQHVMRIYGTKATFLNDDMGARLHLSRDEALAASPISLQTLPIDKGDLIPGFISAVINNEDINDQTQTIFDGLSICIACDKAMQTNKLEEINYI